MPSSNDGPSFSVSETANTSSAQNVHFVDGDSPWTYDIASTHDKISKLTGFDDAQLGSFLSRPVKIAEYSWTPGSQLFQTFNPWTLFFNNADVKEKMNRFRNFKCNLKLKFMINGNPFYYGRALVSYNPYLFSDNVTVNRSFFIQDCIAASNKPHILLDPTTSEGGIIHCPFIWHYNYVDITKGAWDANLGEVIIHDFDTLQHANGGIDPITVTVLAWCEDVDLCVPTTTQMQSRPSSSVKLDKFGYPDILDYQAQSKSKKKSYKKGSNKRSEDEFSPDGLISKPASAVAKAASYLSMVPYIAPYAKATEMIATKVGAVAKIFGYSRPQNLTDTNPYVPRYVGNLANTDTAENVTKLSLDSKNELTIDTRTFGLGGADEMTINSIAQRMTFWRQFDWAESKTPDDLLCSFAVQPTAIDTLAATVGTELHQTAISFAAQPFTCWQGTIKYHFKVVCSEYHRGRLRIVWNPTSLPSGSVPYNQTYSTIIDIGETREFDYEVKWAREKQWVRIPSLNTVKVATTAYYNTSGSATGNGNYDNGVIGVYVVNELATPSTTPADVKIQVWVAAGDDFAVSVPSDHLDDLSYWEEQSRPETMASPVDNSNNPVGGSDVPSFAEGAPDLESKDEQYLVYQGERILSFKDLLRRYWYSCNYLLGDSTPSSYGYTQWFLPGLTPIRGFDLTRGRQQAQNSLAATVKFNYCPMTLLNYLMPAYACYRGSLRHKFIMRGWRDVGNEANMVVSRRDISFMHPYSVAVVPTQGVSSSNVHRNLMQSGQRSGLGTAVTPTRLNNCIEIETPFYQVGEKFKAARILHHDIGTDQQGMTLQVDNSNLLQDRQRRVEQYTAVGEDFTLGMFVGAPIIYRYPDPTAA